jgi:hypothetical protein
MNNDHSVNATNNLDLGKLVEEVSAGSASGYDQIEMSGDLRLLNSGKEAALKAMRAYAVSGNVDKCLAAAGAVRFYTKQ